MAIEQGLTILSWFENLQSKDIPPEHIWADTEGLNSWFKQMREGEERDQVKWSSGESSSDSSSDESAPMHGRPQQSMQNDLARARREG